MAVKIQSDRILNPPSFEKKVVYKLSEEAKTMTWLDWCDRYVEYSIGCGNHSNQIGLKRRVKVRIHEFLKRRRRVKILLREVDTKLIKGLFNYIENTYRNYHLIKEDGKLKPFTLCLFQEVVRAMFNYAIQEELITINPVTELDSKDKFHMPDSHREYLTAEEFMLFMEVEPATQQEWWVQHAFCFACMTGLRISDIRKLTWREIVSTNMGMAVSVIQQKTSLPVTVPLNDLALSFLPERGEAKDDERVFWVPKKNDHVAIYIRRTAERAHINKDLTFHCSRHTAATLAISAGAELYTVSKLLGHGSIKSTQVYAKVDMDSKVEAVNLVDGIFS